MQAVIAVPEIVAEAGEQRAKELLMQKICGVPLLFRTAITAARSGANEILLSLPETLTDELIQDCTQGALQYGVHINVARVSDFDPETPSSWTRLNLKAPDVFLWVPWNWVTNKRLLTDLPLVSMHSVDWSRPTYIKVHEVQPDNASSAFPQNATEGVAVTSPQSAAAAERFLIARSGKVLDGIHTSFNRRLCRPFVRLLSHTSITPNEVTFMGVVVSVLSAVAFARGTYIQSVLGALIFFVAGLFDEMDGMLARVKFMESPRGTWLEGFADGLSYLLLFAAITIGLRRHYGKVAVVIGLVLLVGAILALIVTSLGRRRATAPDRPNEYLGRFYHLLENDSANWISRMVRHVQAFEKRGVMIHYIVLFTVFGGLQLLFLLAAIGAHLTWILSLYFNRRFFAVKANVNTVTEAL
jgi:phosphatidylglycerophosphate synthase